MRHVHKLLKKPSTAFASPTAQSKSDFETKTAAINITPTPDERYDIRKIKEDAQWLSKATKINEVAALRIVVVEFQSRADAHLNGPLSTQDVANIQQAAGARGFARPRVCSQLSTRRVSRMREVLWADFEKDLTRRRRLLTVYLSERRHFMSSLDNLMSFLFYSKIPSTASQVEPLRKNLGLALFRLAGYSQVEGRRI